MKISNIKKKEPFDVYIGRKNIWLDLEDSKWANPFHMKNEGMRSEVLNSYKRHLFSRGDLLTDLVELDSKMLGCYCNPKRCHGNVLLETLEQIKSYDKPILVVSNNINITLEMHDKERDLYYLFCSNIAGSTVINQLVKDVHFLMLVHSGVHGIFNYREAVVYDKKDRLVMVKCLTDPAPIEIK